MRKQLYFGLATALLLGLAGCEKNIDIADSGEHQLVLNGVMSAGRQAFVYFAQTRFFLDSSLVQPVQGANITLKVNGTPYAPDSVSRCKYFFPYTLQENDQLEVDIVANGRTVHAETYVPYGPVVRNFAASHFASPSFNFHLVNMRLDDHAGVDEYYNIIITQRDSGLHHNVWLDTIELIDTLRHTYFTIQNRPEVTSNEVNPYIPLGGYLYSSFMFTDKLIDGQQYQLPIYILQTVDTNEIPPFKHEYIVRVESVTPARWNYILSASSQNSLYSMFAEQGEVRSNVDGALGTFAGTASCEFRFNPDTLPIPTVSAPSVVGTAAISDILLLQ